MSRPQVSARLERAILRTVAYSDVFDYPLTGVEVHRYLDGIAATLAEVRDALDHLRGSSLCAEDGLVALDGRSQLFAVRRRRRQRAERLWPAARRWAGFVGRLPLVRMVAVTGALAVDNVDADADVDYLIVTVPGRVWLCRAMVIQVVRAAGLAGVDLCPNWLLASDALELEERSLFVARELAQMVPVTGTDVYCRMRQVNPWTGSLLPNADGPPRPVGSARPSAGALARTAERVLLGRIGAAVDDWDRRRKRREILGASPATTEVVLDARQCKGHVDAHGARIATAYAERLRALGLDSSEPSSPAASA